MHKKGRIFCLRGLLAASGCNVPCIRRNLYTLLRSVHGQRLWHSTKVSDGVRARGLVSRPIS